MLNKWVRIRYSDCCFKFRKEDFISMIFGEEILIVRTRAGDFEVKGYDGF